MDDINRKQCNHDKNERVLHVGLMQYTISAVFSTWVKIEFLTKLVKFLLNENTVCPSAIAYCLDMGHSLFTEFKFL